MIYGVVQGGLGNQLFQYAATKALAQHHQVNFKLNKSLFQEDSIRAFVLDELIKGESIHIEDIPKRTLIQRILDQFKPWHRRFYIREREGGTGSLFFNFPKQCVLDGFWQQEAFVKPIANELRSALLIEASHPPNQIAVHFRGGDYINNPQTASYHGVLDEAYYQESFNAMIKQFPNAQFTLFSDSPANFQFSFLSDFKVEWMDEPNEVCAFKAMLKFQSFIIANSSFSWWAAYLNHKKEGRIIAPKRWFKTESLENYSPALKEWIS